MSTTNLTKTTIARAGREGGGRISVAEVEGRKWWTNRFFAGNVSRTAHPLLGNLEPGAYELKGTKATREENVDPSPIENVVGNETTRDDLAEVSFSWEVGKARAIVLDDRVLYRLERQDGEAVYVRQDFLNVLIGEEDPREAPAGYRLRQAEGNARRPVLVEDTLSGDVVGLVMPHVFRAD